MDSAGEEKHDSAEEMLPKQTYWGGMGYGHFDRP